MHSVIETLKDYASKALISTVDHLGSVAYKVDNFLDEKVNEISAARLQFSCLEQVPTCSYNLLWPFEELYLTLTVQQYETTWVLFQVNNNLVYEDIYLYKHVLSLC